MYVDYLFPCVWRPKTLTSAMTHRPTLGDEPVDSSCLKLILLFSNSPVNTKGTISVGGESKWGGGAAPPLLSLMQTPTHPPLGPSNNSARIYEPRYDREIARMEGGERAR